MRVMAVHTDREIGNGLRFPHRLLFNYLLASQKCEGVGASPVSSLQSRLKWATLKGGSPRFQVHGIFVGTWILLSF